MRMTVKVTLNINECVVCVDVFVREYDSLWRAKCNFDIEANFVHISIKSRNNDQSSFLFFHIQKYAKLNEKETHSQNSVHFSICRIKVEEQSNESNHSIENAQIESHVVHKSIKYKLTYFHFSRVFFFFHVRSMWLSLFSFFIAVYFSLFFLFKVFKWKIKVLLP